MSYVRFCARLGFKCGFAGKRNDDEDAKEKLYTYATYVPVTTFKASLFYYCLKLLVLTSRQGLETVVVDAE